MSLTQQNNYNGKQKKKNKIQNTNFSVKFQAYINQWNHDFKHPKMPNLDTTQKLLHPYSKVTHANVNQNSQLELCHLPFSDIHLYN
jgi:hypothetical protein